MKKLFLTFSVLVLLGVGASFVFGNFINFEKNIRFIESDSKNIYPDSKNLNNNILVFQSNTDISKYKVKSLCKNELKYIGKKSINKSGKGDFYFFNFKLLDNKCENPNFLLKNGKENFAKSYFKLNIVKKIDLFSLMVDYNNFDLKKIKLELDNKIKKYSIYKNVSINSKENYFKLIKNKRFYEELVYKRNILIHILNRRESRYSVPVKGYKIATKLNVIPNAGRPYRDHYTDGIHHGWDIMAPRGTMTSAIDDGLIIRVVRDFSFEDISKIVKNGKISYEQKLRNLDILRGNQVWLKTSKGDVMFYSHLGKIPDNIKEGVFVSVGQDIGTIDRTGVPDRNYTNYHLHFPIMKNPYNRKKAGKYSWEDYMAWDWYLKGQTPDEIIKNQKEIFLDEAF